MHLDRTMPVAHRGCGTSPISTTSFLPYFLITTAFIVGIRIVTTGLELTQAPPVLLWPTQLNP
jgi:hypothetical protein